MSLLFFEFLFSCLFNGNPAVFIHPLVKLPGFCILFNHIVNYFQHIIIPLLESYGRYLLGTIKLYISQGQVIIVYQILLRYNSFKHDAIQFAVLQLKHSIRHTGKANSRSSFHLLGCSFLGGGFLCTKDLAF